ncbi:Serine/threonine-protein kinase RIO3 [Trachymyrmex zeteki]|uniref:Serine/threonine-protein kinase RIO3 n=1 Tax=Mycetomoellerius zeteki TaxID=64791 RepID=A0A151X8S0_9HYME|nr:PREDICTED: serine/threonine-protein kinase RIO3-like [Trachymyrmex zeteki]XP_018301646.1 PREDICTED: serine/threonine-protein kinase RIO3-like [Trachymyrmex zeteki]KYQ56729.1 Serine/threonine-protein kinase RIO3 [Trachymyrmex zeteki]
MATPKVWAKIQPLESPVNLLDITTEQLAASMQERELKKCFDEDNVNVMDKTMGETYDASDTGNDEVIAYLLQTQFNREYDTMLKRTEEKFNRDSKVSISFSNYRSSLYNIKDEDNADCNVDDSNRDIDRFVSIEKEYASIPRCGYKKMGKDSRIVTKHDILMSSRINACRLLQFPPGIHTGDTGGFDVKLNNKVYNSLLTHSRAQYSKERAKVSPKSKTHSK